MFFNEKTSNHRCGVAPTSSTPSRLGVSLDVSMMSWIIIIFRRTRRSARRRGRSRRTAAARWTVRATGRRRRRGTSSPSPPTSSATRSRCLFSLSSFKQTNNKQQTNRRRPRRQRVNRISSDKCLGLVDVVPRHGIPMTCPVSLQKEKDVIVKRDTVVATNPNWVLLRSAVGAEDGRPMSELYFFFYFTEFCASLPGAPSAAHGVGEAVPPLPRRRQPPLSRVPRQRMGELPSVPSFTEFFYPFFLNRASLRILSRRPRD